MKFSIDRDEFLKALTAVQGVVEKRNTMPILSNILLEANETGELRTTATDLEVGITSLFEAKVKESGKITLNAKNLMDITRQLPSSEVTFQLLSNSDVELSCGKIHFKLHGLPAEDYPALPEVQKKNTFTMPAKELETMIEHTIFSVSHDETRYNLSGVLFEQIDQDTLRMVSSDGHRLSLMDRKVPSIKDKLGENLIIPRKGLIEIRKLCSEADGDIEFGLSKSNCMVQHGDTKLVIRIIDGEFPDYRQVLPSSDHQKKITFEREQFLNALKRVSILSQEKTRGVRFQFEKNLFKINVNNPDLGEAEEEMEIEFDHPPLEIGFNARYFLDVLSLLKVDKVDLLLSDSMSQGLLTVAGDTSFQAVIMPMKLL